MTTAPEAPEMHRGVRVGKDYLFATDWGPLPWLFNVSYPVVIAATFLARRRRGVMRSGRRRLRWSPPPAAARTPCR